MKLNYFSSMAAAASSWLVNNIKPSALLKQPSPCWFCRAAVVYTSQLLCARRTADAQ